MNGEQGQIMNHDQKNCRPSLAQFLEVLKITVFLKSAWKWKRLVFSSKRQWIFTRGASISVTSPWITEISGQKWNIGVSCKSRKHFKSQKVDFYEAPSSATKGALNIFCVLRSPHCLSKFYIWFWGKKCLNIAELSRTLRRKDTRLYGPWYRLIRK